MEALIELCDLIAQNPAQFSDKLTWLCAKCPSIESFSAGSPRVSRAQLNAVIVVARFLSKCSDYSDLRPRAVVLDFLRAIPYSFDPSFWPQGYNGNSIASFYVDFLSYVVKAAELSSEFAEEMAEFSGEVILCAIGKCGELSGVNKAFLVALSQNFIPVSALDANKLVTCLIDQFAFMIPVSGEHNSNNNGVNSESSSSQSSPLNVNHHSQLNSVASPGNSVSTASSRGSVMNGDRSLWLSDQLSVNLGLHDGGGSGGSSGMQVASFEEESVGNLEKQGIALKLIAHILEKAKIDPGLLEQVGLIAKKQIQSMSVFLRVMMFFVMHIYFSVLRVDMIIMYILYLREDGSIFMLVVYADKEEGME